MVDQDYLYIFLHIPKCAGTTIRYHIYKNFKNEEYLYLSPKKLGIKKEKVYKNPEIYERSLSEYFKKYPKNNLSRVKILFGHRIPYGVHKYFSKIPRYFTFFRDPISRTISIYNYKKDLYIDKVIKERRNRPVLEKSILIDGKVPDFKDWINNIYYKGEKPSSMTLYKFLLSLGYLSEGNLKKKDLYNDLEKFYFIGTLENFEEDSLYIYDKLGINKYFVSQNVSKKTFLPIRSKKLIKLIKEKNGEDMMIYKAADKRSKRIKNNLDDYVRIVNKTKIKRRLLLPFTQTYYAPKETLKAIMKCLTKRGGYFQKK